MRTLLASHFTKNISKSTKSSCSFPGYQCNPYLTIGAEQCLDLGNNDNAYFFYPPVNVQDMNGGKTQGVYIISGGCYLVSGISDFHETLAVSYESKKDDATMTTEAYFVSKQDAELNLKTDYDVKVENEHTSGEASYNVFYVVNPNNFAAEADGFDDLDSNILLDTDFIPYDIPEITKDNPKISGAKYGEFHIYPKFEPVTQNYELTASGSLTIKISGEDPGNVPQKTWKIVRNKLYTKDTPDDDLPGSGLSAGAIAGIVIACVVVVAVVVFCIVWFVVLKKPCPCGKKSDEPAA